MIQKGLCDHLVGVDGRPLRQPLLSKYERGIRPVPLDIMLQIATVLGCRVEDLASRE